RYLSKPFTSDQLFQVLESCAGGAESAPAVVSQPLEPKAVDAILDQAALSRIRALHRPGGPNPPAKVLGLDKSSSPAPVAELRAAALSQDAEGLRQAAHALKSSSANIGAMALADLSREIELAASAGNIDQACLLFDSLSGEHARVLQALESQDLAA